MAGQFSRLSAAAIRDARLPDKAVRVLGEIGIYADKDGKAWPSIATIAAALDISERQTQRLLRRLEALGYIEIEKTIRATKGGWGRNRYWLKYPAANTATEVTSIVSPRDVERGDINSVTSETLSEVTSQAGRGDIANVATEVTPAMSDELAHRISPMGNQPNGHAAHLKIRERKNGVIVYENGDWVPDTDSHEWKSQPDPQPWWAEEDARQGESPKPATEPKAAKDPYEGLTAEERQWSIWIEEERRHYEATCDIRRWKAFNKQLALRVRDKPCEWPPKERRPRGPALKVNPSKLPPGPQR